MPRGGGRSTRQWMLWAFKLHGCADCGVRYPDIALGDLHCDHRDPTTKTPVYGRGADRVAALTTGLLGHNSNDELLTELVKCDVVCGPCHRKRHRNGKYSDHVQGALFSGTGGAWQYPQG